MFSNFIVVFSVMFFGLIATVRAEPVTEVEVDEFKKSISANSAKRFDTFVLDPQVYQVEVDCNVDRMVMAGKYVRRSVQITHKNFFVAGCKSDQVDLRLVSLDHMINTEQALGELYQRGFRPATLLELLAFGISFPELQRKSPIVALGTQWRNPDSGETNTPILTEFYDNERGLALFKSDPVEHGWHSFLQFLVVRK